MADPLVSIVIATRERPALLQRAIESILKQSLREIEILVVDDGSTQPTLDAYPSAGGQADPRVAYHLAAEAPRLIRGVCAARNYGLSLARAPYIVFFDDDDEMSVADHLEVAVKHHGTYPRCLYFGDMRMMSDGKVKVPARIRPFDASIVKREESSDPPVYVAGIKEFGQVLAHRFPHLNACLLDTALAREAGGFTEPLFLGEDINFVFRYADVCSGVVYRRECVVDFDVTPRPRAFEALEPLQRDLVCSIGLSLSRVHLKDPHLIRTSAGVEACMLASVAAGLNSRGQTNAARYLARQSLALKPTRNGLSQFLGSFSKPRGSAPQSNPDSV